MSAYMKHGHVSLKEWFKECYAVSDLQHCKPNAEEFRLSVLAQGLVTALLLFTRKMLLLQRKQQKQLLGVISGA